MKEYWFTIYPHCFLWLKGEEGLVYNTENYHKLRFHNTDILAEKTKQLIAMENLYCIRLNAIELMDKNLNEWVQDIISQECGTLVEDDGKNQRPLSLPPILRVQDEKEHYRWLHRQGVNGNALENLHRIIFHINGSTYGNELYAKQTLCPTTVSEALPAEDILRFAMNARVSPFLTEIVLVGNPFVYEGLEELIESLQSICPVSVSCTWLDAMTSTNQAKELTTKTNLNIVVTDGCSLDNLPKEATYTFLVTSEQEYESALVCEEIYGTRQVNVLPVYNGNNLNFFEDYLYIDEESIKDITLDKREVFIRQKLNIQDFGQLTIMPDGKVYANPNFPAIGNIKETPKLLSIGKSPKAALGSASVIKSLAAIASINGYAHHHRITRM